MVDDFFSYWRASYLVLLFSLMDHGIRFPSISRQNIVGFGNPEYFALNVACFLFGFNVKLNILLYALDVMLINDPLATIENTKKSMIIIIVLDLVITKLLFINKNIFSFQIFT